MAHFWVEERDGTWAIAQINSGNNGGNNGDGCALSVKQNKSGERSPLLCRAEGLARMSDNELRNLQSNVLLLKTTSPGSSSGDGAWLLISPPGLDIRVNGIRLTGLKRLHHRDEIRVAGVGRFYFSTERLAREEPFPGHPEGSGATRKMLCGRCKSPIRKGDTVIQCPECGLWHHQSRESGRLCWTYASHCSGCACSTEILDRYRWCPDGL